MITADVMNRLIQYVADNQNETLKLNAGQMREAVKLVLRALALELLGHTIKPQQQQEPEMPAKKKGKPAKKAAAKPMPKKK